MHWETEQNEQEGYGIFFKDEFFSPPQQRLLHGFIRYAIATRKALIEIPPSTKNYFNYYFELLYQEQQAEGNQNQVFILQNIMLALLNKLEGFIQYQSNPNSFINQRAIFQEFVTLIETYYKTQKSVSFYTAVLNLPARNLNEILKDLIGSTAQDLIIDRTLLEAKRELSFTTKSIKEIAFDLGYETPHYFSRIFKKKILLSPEEFRKRFAE